MRAMAAEAEAARNARAKVIMVMVMILIVMMIMTMLAKVIMDPLQDHLDHGDVHDDDKGQRWLP